MSYSTNLPAGGERAAGVNDAVAAFTAVTAVNRWSIMMKFTVNASQMNAIGSTQHPPWAREEWKASRKLLYRILNKRHPSACSRENTVSAEGRFMYPVN